MYDLIIIGAGPAGITAGIYAARKKMDTLIITKDVGGQTAWSGDIENYTGYQFISGLDLVAKFEEHIRKYAIHLKEGEEVESLNKVRDVVYLKTNKAEYEARTVIIASGKRSKELGVPGEKEFKNRGLTFCATCDGPLFSGKDVAVIGGGNSALDAVLQLARIAKKVYVINNTISLGADAIMREKVIQANNVILFNQARVIAITGDKFVSGIKIKAQDEEKSISLDGVFVEVGLKPNSEFAPDAEKNAIGEIKVNCNNETNLPGIFAAGDVTDIQGKQIIIACGEGAKSCLSAFSYLNQHKFSDDKN
ncbi:MAG: FAD-dependent oxidoreductase [Candidatus Omnitrophota bacterium]|nr:FAD-dependent oxidoreductase [Candidatus Omnitrophota bacterium]MBU1929700.1 FAD-dependent oxidoreductase [Candidatus Omnitrophota bacterium]MBU2035098.1 FAD-dependent oxidoreductase [Candidatus Omnitrophota bacterium]MBU2221221.1 FAD-dependent oxidoreductase [Candidatus Omnitrophota bacterium]MBU2257983.1 FAD-dependent oxidoreductase [Candidatus Omnitrophota bacterium]